ncbi:MAG: TRAP transporter small permease subunit [Oligoflexus sp.]
MASWLLKAMRAIEGISRGLQKFCGIACILLVLITVQQVAARYIWQSSSVALQELQWHLFGLIFLLAGAACLASDEHVRVDVFYSQLNPRQKAWINLLGVLLFILPCCWILMTYGWQDVQQARGFHTSITELDSNTKTPGIFSAIGQFFLTGESSPDPGGLPARWIIKSALPLGTLFLFLQAIVLAMQSLRLILKPRSQ